MKAEYNTRIGLNEQKERNTSPAAAILSNALTTLLVPLPPGPQEADAWFLHP